MNLQFLQKPVSLKYLYKFLLNVTCNFIHPPLPVNSNDNDTETDFLQGKLSEIKNIAIDMPI